VSPWRALLLSMALLATPVVHAAECELQLGHGWPPATENHGSAVEALLAGGASPALSLTWLPKRGVESGLMLLPSANGGDWTLRHARPPDRVDERDRSGGSLRRVLRVDQQPEVLEVPIPAALATRLLEGWQRVLQAGVPAAREARFHDDDLLTLVIGGERVSGLEPDCGAAELMMEQADELVDLADEEDADDRLEGWQDLQRSLDELDGELAAAG